MWAWLRRLRPSVWVVDTAQDGYEPRSLRQRLQIFFGIRGRF